MDSNRKLYHPICRKMVAQARSLPPLSAHRIRAHPQAEDALGLVPLQALQRRCTACTADLPRPSQDLRVAQEVDSASSSLAAWSGAAVAVIAGYRALSPIAARFHAGVRFRAVH